MRPCQSLFSMIAAGCVFAATMTTVFAADPPKELFAYFGTYTNGGKSKGIYCYRFDLNSGKLTEVGVTEGVKNPSFVAIHPSGKFLYSVSEVNDADGKPAGAVMAFALDRKSGKLTALNHQSSEGQGPCHVNVDKTGQCALVANYGSGSIASLPIMRTERLRRPPRQSSIPVRAWCPVARPDPTRIPSTFRPITALPLPPTWAWTRS